MAFLLKNNIFIKKRNLLLLLVFLKLFCKNENYEFDAVIIGPMDFQCSIPRMSIVWIDCLKEQFKINYINSRPTKKMNLQDLNPAIYKIKQQSVQKCTAKVSILLDLIWDRWSTPSNLIPPSLIKIAYSMLESSAIPIEWVKLINSKFDAVIVPDEFLVKVYKSSGVTKPIFVLPLALYIDEFLTQPRKSKNRSVPFIFGCTSSLIPRKNIELLVDAFADEFGNNPKFQLIIHSRYEEPGQKNILQTKIIKKKISNIKIILKKFTQKEYIDFLSQLDCYVLLSKGEGFSISPREALALGIPCILTNNTAHTTICKSGFVKSIETPILTNAYYFPLGKSCGFQFTCTKENVRSALKEVHNNYNVYIKKAEDAFPWVEKYNLKYLESYYRTVIKPKRVILGKNNLINSEEIITNNLELYNKYKSLI